MDTEKTIAYWHEGALYDLDTGRNLLDAGKRPYALFFGHLAIEKLLKALVVRATGEHAPFSHSLPALAGKTGLTIPEEIMDALADFTEFHIEARYPDERREFYTRCTEPFARVQFKRVEEVVSWLMSRLAT